MTVQELDAIPKTTRGRLTIGIINSALSTLRQLTKNKSKVFFPCVEMHLEESAESTEQSPSLANSLDTSCTGNIQTLILNKKKMTRDQTKVYEVRLSC